LIKDLGNYTRPIIGLNGEDAPELKTIFLFLFRTNENVLKPIDKENPEARWVNKDDVATLLTHPKDKEFFREISDKYLK